MDMCKTGGDTVSEREKNFRSEILGGRSHATSLFEISNAK